jgi:riboflavin kinase/FMN adenylyltransferase
MKIRGDVVKGEGRGRTLGYPTANIAVPDGLAATDGVYVARVRVEGKEYGAMANLGVKPTFSEGKDNRVLELHLLDFEGDLYGRELTIELGEFIRPEQKFASLEALRTQIETDEKQIKNILKCI